MGQLSLHASCHVVENRCLLLAAGDGARAKRLRNLSEGRPSMKQMAADFGLLAAELRRVLGDGGPMPRRTVLRNLKRYDLEEVGAPAPQHPHCTVHARQRFLQGDGRCAGAFGVSHSGKHLAKDHKSLGKGIE